MTRKTCSYLLLLDFNYRSNEYFPLIFNFIIQSSQWHETSVFLSVCKIGLTGFLLLSQTVIELILIICEFCIYEFAYSLKFICDPKINTRGAFRVIHRHAQNAEKRESPTCMCRQGDALLSYFNSHNVNKCPLQSLFSANFHIFVLFWVISLFKMPPSIVLMCGRVLLSARRL